MFKKLIAIMLLSLPIVACTPEQMAVWQSLTPDQKTQVVEAAGTKPSHRELGRSMALSRGYSETDWACLDNVIMRESAWRNVPNAAGGKAYGIPQSLPGSKMSSHGADWRTNPVTQINWLLDYIDDRYKTPCAAWSFKRSKGWY